MEIDPHTIQQILTKVRDQLRCPQCRKRVDVDLESLKVLGDTFAVMQLRCTMCDAYIMLHATLSADGNEIEQIKLKKSDNYNQASQNASSKLMLDQKEIKGMGKAIEEAGGFNNLFDPQ